MVSVPTNSDEAWYLALRMESYYASMFEGISEDDAFYEGLLDEFYDSPDGFELTIPTTGRAIVDEAVDNATPEDFLISYSPRGKHQNELDAADAVRIWCKSLLLHWRRSGQDIDFIRDFMKNLFKSGMACFKVAPDFSLWPQLSEDTEKEIVAAAKAKGSDGRKELMTTAEKIKRARAENTPILIRSIPPNCIMPDPSTSGRKLTHVERYMMSPEEIQREYEVVSDVFRNNFQQATSYPVHEVWTASHIGWDGKWYQGKHWVYVNWEVVLDEDNPYDDNPYITKFSGYGREAYEGRPEYKSVGFFTRQLKSMLLAEMRRFTSLDAIMSQIAFPIVFLDQAAEMSGVKFIPGYVNYVPERVLSNIQNMWVVPKIPTADYANNMQAISGQIERGSVQRALRGGSVSGVDSAQHYTAVTGQAKLRIESVIQVTEQALSMALSMALRYVDQILGEPVSVVVADDRTQKATIGPAQIKGHYIVEVKFQPNEEAEKERKLILATDAIAKAGLAPYDAYEMAGFENPGEMVESRLVAKALDDPIITRAVARAAAKNWGFDIEKMEMEERVADFKKQQELNSIIEMLQLGTGTGVGGGGPMGMAPGGGTPPPAPTGPPQGIGGVPGMPSAPGAPPAVQPPGVAGVMAGIGAANSGLNP